MFFIFMSYKIVYTYTKHDTSHKISDPSGIPYATKITSLPS